MLLTKSLAIFNILKITNTVFYLYGSFGSFFFSVVNFGLNKKFFFQTAQNSKNILRVFFRKLLGCRFGWRVRLKLIGRGLSFFKRNNFVYMNIGRSHIVRFFINLNTRIVCLKKKMTLISSNFDYLRKISYMLTTAQPSLIYKAKGLIYEFYNYKIKPGKIKQYRV